MMKPQTLRIHSHCPRSRIQNGKILRLWHDVFLREGLLEETFRGMTRDRLADLKSIQERAVMDGNGIVRAGCDSNLRSEGIHHCRDPGMDRQLMHPAFCIRMERQPAAVVDSYI